MTKSGQVRCAYEILGLERYQTIKTAQAEIDELFKDINGQIESGERAPDDAYDREDYRIFDTVKGEYVA